MPATSIIVLLLLVPALVAAKEPLLQAGKTSIYQRLLTRPGALLAPSPGDTNGTLVNAFSRFYVYGRQREGAEEWLQVGTDTGGREIQGWIASGQTVPWKQQLTLAFTNPGANRDRLLFFRNGDDVTRILTAPSPADIASPLVRKIADGGQDESVLAIEPETFVDINEQFYLLPILDYRELAASSGDKVRVLKVASVTKQRLPPPGGETAAATTAPEATPSTPASATSSSTAIRTPAAAARSSFTPLKSFKAALVFVTDSTISMKRYIQETKAAVERVYRRVKEAELLDMVAFGLVAYRADSQDAEHDRRLEYVAKEFADPSEVRDARGFFERVGALREAPIPTDQFDEDAYAGILMALEDIRWSDFGARYIVLISDAGALEGDASTTGLDADRLRSLAGEQGIALYVLHLRTPAGRDDHARARDQYLRLSRNAAVQESLYFPVSASSPKRLGKTIDALAESIIANIRQASKGGTAAGSVTTATRVRARSGPTTAPANATKAEQPTQKSKATGAGEADLERLRAITNALGHAMQLAYLGKARKTLAPTVFEAWISDRDFADPTKRTVDVRVLLTKNQLSDMQMILQQVVHAAETGMLEPDRFFASLRSLAVQIGRDPNLARRPEATHLADLGLLGEYLDDLPYRSDVMDIDQDTWTHWGPQRQLAFTNRLKSKIRLYERYNADWRRWINLAQSSSAGSGDWVYPVPLRDLP